MGKGVSLQFEECLKKGRLKLSPESGGFVEKELRVAANDLKEAMEGLGNSRWKWCTIQAYYVMFHSARALLFAKGYRERSHFCLRTAIEYLYTDIVSQYLIDDFQTAKIMRENADYEENFSEIGAKKIVKSAEAFLTEAKKIIGLS